MPAIYNSLVGDGLTPHTAWRVAFVVPGICITAVALALLLLCQDTPTGKWSDRMQAAENNLRQHHVHGTVVDVPGQVTEDGKRSGTSSPPSGLVDEEKKLDNTRGTFNDHEAQMGEQQMLDTAQGEVVQKPSFAEIAKVCLSPRLSSQALATSVPSVLSWPSTVFLEPTTASISKVMLPTLDFRLRLTGLRCSDL